MTCLPGSNWEDWEDSLTVPRLDALQKEWKVNPPVHFLVAAAFGHKRPEKPRPISELLDMFPSGVISGV